MNISEILVLQQTLLWPFPSKNVRMGLFQGKKPPFEINAGVPSSERTIGRDDAVTGDDDEQRIAFVCLTDSL